MTRRVRQGWLATVGAMCAVLLCIVLLNRQVLEKPEPPSGLDASAAWLAEHPADWITAASIADSALDSDSPRRIALWRAAHAHAKRLAPYRPNADAAFVRAGLFHWYELGPRERADVKTAAAPLLRDPNVFAQMHVPLWQLTRDFAWLHANAPDRMDARMALRDLAVARGLFGEYRVLREDVRARRMREFTAARANTDPAALLSLLPDRITVADEPLVTGILEELDRKSFDAEQFDGRAESLVDYAVRHDIQPLTGVLPLLETNKLRDVTRARAALDLNNVPAASRIEIASAVNGAPEWEPYLIDRALFEARRRDAAAADAYLVRASSRGMSIPLLAAAEQVAIHLNNERSAADYRRLLTARAKEPRTWSSSCGANELCAVATRDEYVSGDRLRLELAMTQSDETAPYVEIYVDDALRAEGDVRDSRVFEIRTGPGLHSVELRLVNPRTRNGTQRRVRIS